MHGTGFLDWEVHGTGVLVGVARDIILEIGESMDVSHVIRRKI